MPPFPKNARLLKPKEFDSLREKASSMGNRYFRLRWLPREKRRLGLVVSKKVAKAARRNGIKRIVREFFRQKPALFPLGDVVVIANPPAGKLTKEKIWDELENALSPSKRN